MVRRLSCSWDILLVLWRLCSSMPVPVAFFSVGFWKNFCSVFLSSACGFLFMAFSRQLAAIGILFVVSSTGGCLTGSVLCSSSSRLSFFSCEFLLGTWWCSPVGALASSHLPFVALLLLFKYLCLLLLVSFFAFSQHASLHFLSGFWLSGCGVVTVLSVRFKEFFVGYFVRYFFFFKVLEPLLGFIVLLRQHC